MNTISIITFIIATGSVAYFTFRIVQKMKKTATRDRTCYVRYIDILLCNQTTKAYTFGTFSIRITKWS